MSATRAPGTARLTDKEQAWAANVGRRLQAEFSALVSALPAHERTGPGLERLLGVHRAIAYRVISALAATDDIEVLNRIPGVEGLRKCVVGARGKLGADSEAVLAGAASAIEDFQELIRAGGGSHARLVARIGATKGNLAKGHVAAPPGRREDVRRAMHEAVQVLAGRSVVARTSVSIIRPRPDSPGELEYVHARAHIGFRAVAGGLPLVLSSWVTQQDNVSGRLPGLEYCDLKGSLLEGRGTTGLLDAFCSSPLPIVTSRDTTGRLIQVLDHLHAEPGASMDAVMAYRLPRVGPIPQHDDPPVFLQSTNLSVPAERLVADLYVHRSLSSGCTPSLHLYLGRGTGGCDLIDRWHEQIDGAPLLSLLGTGLGNAHSDAWERHAEMTRHVFDQLGWDPREYVGFRGDETWPLWNCDYVTALDYRVRADDGARSPA
ncbi:MAG: hypothetical protein KF705_15250 [Phycisphaeraceae bacterium]|nr:hypothetical protein [Phycisphaeraceae bacterium]